MQNFPNFEKLNLRHKNEIETMWKEFPPYSDYNFTSLYSYDVDDSAEVCFLNKNLVVVMPDYTSAITIISFLGIEKLDETIQVLLKYSLARTDICKLKLIPEITVRSITNSKDLEITEDIDNHDYVLDAISMVTLVGNRWFAIKRDVRNFKEKHNYKFVSIDLNSDSIRKQMDGLFDLWIQQKDKDSKTTETERNALKRSFIFANEPDHFSFGLFVNDRMIGYSTNQIVHDGFYMGHFGKADADYPGAYQIMEHECAKFFLEKGCKFMNYEQDLGIPGLRQAKRSWNPVSYLKKYTIKPVE